MPQLLTPVVTAGQRCRCLPEDATKHEGLLSGNLQLGDAPLIVVIVLILLMLGRRRGQRQQCPALPCLGSSIAAPIVPVRTALPPKTCHPAGPWTNGLGTVRTTHGSDGIGVSVKVRHHPNVHIMTNHDDGQHDDQAEEYIDLSAMLFVDKFPKRRDFRTCKYGQPHGVLPPNWFLSRL